MAPAHQRDTRYLMTVYLWNKNIGKAVQSFWISRVARDEHRVGVPKALIVSYETGPCRQIINKNSVESHLSECKRNAFN